MLASSALALSSRPLKVSVPRTRANAHDGSKAPVQTNAVPWKPRMPKHEHVVAGVVGGVASTVLSVLLATQPVQAADAAKVGVCLLSSCPQALTNCIGDSVCLQSLVCLNQCDGPDETACQIRCGDLYSDKAIDAFNACAVSEKKCVPQRVDEGLYPVPPDCALDRGFDLDKFQGRWYITAGLNPLFDQFDCQEHFFAVPEDRQLVGKINWRINKPDGDFIERSTLQRFKQDPENSALLSNRGNEYLNYMDDWYILASKPDEYVFIYYIGNNDAWRGYGGATVYTRAASLPEEYIPELKKAAESAGLDWDKFKITDNTCGDHPAPKKGLIQVLEEDLEDNLLSFGRGFTVFEDEVLKAEKALEASIIKDLRASDEEFFGFEEEQTTIWSQIKDFFGFGREPSPYDDGKEV